MVFDGVRWWGVDGCSVVGVDGGYVLLVVGGVRLKGCLSNFKT